MEEILRKQEAQEILGLQLLSAFDEQVKTELELNSFEELKKISGEDITRILSDFNEKPNVRSHFFFKEDYLRPDGTIDEDRLNTDADSFLKDLFEFKDGEHTELDGYKISLEDFKKNIISENFVRRSSGFNDFRCFKSRNGEIVKVSAIFTKTRSDLISSVKTRFHELCHNFQNLDFDITKQDYWDYKYNKILTDDPNLEKSENQIKVKEKFLESFLAQSQANLFGDLYLLLKAYETKDIEIINYIKNQLIKHSNSTNDMVLSGYFEFPVLIKLLETFDESQAKEFYDGDKIDFQKLYKFTLEKMQEQKAEYEKFLMQPEVNILEFQKYMQKISLDTPKTEINPLFQSSPIVKDMLAMRIKKKELIPALRNDNDLIEDFKSHVPTLQRFEYIKEQKEIEKVAIFVRNSKYYRKQVMRLQDIKKIREKEYKKLLDNFDKVDKAISTLVGKQPGSFVRY